ncbi:jg20199 [Pararge aegeria aegeria]|uniref:Jg20199 protein n=1 Tax=Pararge aegeria aegeria TaxID=348720 RepID=A0A8S4RZ25_9NEOP|nr:jg20199 [Pararge aegeria aegeria]
MHFCMYRVHSHQRSDTKADRTIIPESGDWSQISEALVPTRPVSTSGPGAVTTLLFAERPYGYVPTCSDMKM